MQSTIRPTSLESPLVIYAARIAQCSDQWQTYERASGLCFDPFMAVVILLRRTETIISGLQHARQ